MFANLFASLRAAKVPVTLREYLLLIEAVNADLAGQRVEDFYFLARCSLIKDERHLDTFDRVFGHVFKGLDLMTDAVNATIPEDWLRSVSALHLSDEDKARIEALGGWDKIMEELNKRLAEQQGRHQGGSKWIGTGGTSPYGADGYNPAGVRIGQKESRHKRAIKVWDKREFKDFADDVEIGTRNMKVALRKLRRLTRTGRPDELDVDETVRGTAHNGYLDIHLRPERRNAVKVLMFLDVGGSMDWHVKEAQELFSAARSEFKHLEYFYFHNCLYEHVWKDNVRRWTDKTPTWDVLHTYPADTKVIFVGDASMSPYEISVPGGAAEHMNPEPGAKWLTRVADLYERCVWLNPLPQESWAWTPSIGMIERLMPGRMFPLTIDGLDRAIRVLMR
ncbi:MAG: VWA domain-containing protein [Hyphomicrobium sp.]|nr:MAG: VWA domain-containing protein [Hyphomicrobium sp.]